MLTGIAVFAVTYALISARRLGWLPVGRPGAALLGATATVGLGVLRPEQALAAVDGHTIVLLFGMLAMGAFLDADGFFERAAAHVIRHVKTPRGLLAGIVWGAGISASLITNDAVCVFAAPLLVRIVEKYRLRPLPFLLALATSANTGSVATLVGNPQNMLCGHLGALTYRHYALVMAPVAIVGLALNHIFLRLLFRRDLDIELEPSAPDGKLFTSETLGILAVIAISAVLYLAGTDLAWTAAGGAAVLLVLIRRPAEQIWPRIDWSVLLFFAGLFVVVEGFVQCGATAWLFARYPLGIEGAIGSWFKTSLVFLLGSNVVSNVPFILVVRDQMSTLPDPKLGWELLAMASTFAGNLTLIGSVANVIVAESARSVGGMGFLSHLRVGLPLALATTGLGTIWLLFVMH